MTTDHDACCAPRRLSWWELWPMLGWGAFVAYLYLTNRMTLFLRPAYGHLAAAGAFLLLACFGYGWLLRRQALRAAARAAAGPEHAPADACRAAPSPWRYVRSLAFLVPLVIGFSLPERGLNALAALQRGAADPAMVAELADQRRLEQAEMKGHYAWTTVLGMAQRLQMPGPQKVGALGFVARGKETPPGEFLLVRFMIGCCAADATPVAVPVRWPDAASLPENEWVEVYGETDPGKRVLVAEEVIRTTPPRHPYM